MSKVASELDFLAEGDRRRWPRQEFGVVQQVAETECGEPPTSESFKRVQIVDVSCDGFSFYTLSEPQRENLVVVMGDPPDVDCHGARVVYCKPLEQYGHTLYRIGCQFTGDVKLDVREVIDERNKDTACLLRQLTGLQKCAEGSNAD